MDSPSVFADPSGRRHKRFRLIGLVAGIAVVACLGVVAVGLGGGPTAPFLSWIAPRHGAHGHGPAGAATKPATQASQRVHATPSPAAPPSGAPVGSPSPRRSSPSPVTSSPTASGSATPTTPAPTNPAGKTPPGQTRSPNPHKSSHAR